MAPDLPLPGRMEASAGPAAHPALLRTTVLGIPLDVDRSWLVTLAGAALFGGWLCAELVPGLSLPAAALLGAGLAGGLWLSLLAHELAHAVMAMRAGSRVLQIRFFAGGALCRREDNLSAPRDQLRVVAAGPAASAALAVLAAGAALVATAAGAPAAAVLALWLLATANGVIAVTNLLPVPPLDGGRLIHALHWRAGHEPAVAAARTARTGREFARVVIWLGVLLAGMSGEVLVGVSVAAFGLYLLRLPALPGQPAPRDGDSPG